MESLEAKDIKPSNRRSKKVKNLEEEVEFILSQDESGDEAIPKDDIEILPKTPSRNENIKDVFTPRASQAVLQEMLQTPRRSCRKSIKPTQEYDDIVSRSCTRPTRSAKKDFMIAEEKEQADLENAEDHTNAQPRWTPAKVGRVSKKRARKSRRTTKQKNAKQEEKEEVEVSNLVNLVDHKEDDENMMEGNKEDEVNKEEEYKGVEVIENVTGNIIDENINMEKHKENEIGLLENNTEDEVVEENKEDEGVEEDKEDEVVNVEENRENEIINLEDNREDVIMDTEDHEVIDEGHEVVNMEVNTVNEVLNMEEQENDNVKVDDVRVDDHKKEHVIAEKNRILREDATDSLIEFMKIEHHINQENVKELPTTTGEPALCLEVEDDEDDEQNLLELNKNQDFSSIPEDQICLKVEEEEKSSETSSNPSKTQEDSFGYLKSNEIDMADLGLNPLKDDDQKEEEKENKIFNEDVESQDSEEMPSLIICDEDEEVRVLKEGENKLNETFEADESVLFVGETIKSSQDNMETLKMSDDEGGATPKKVPRITVTQNQTLNQLSTPKRNVTLNQLSTPTQMTTPKQSVKAYRFPTPYRNRQNYKFSKDVQNVHENNSSRNAPTGAYMSTLEPKEIVLRGIRKRSLSVCIDGKDAKRQKPLAGPLAKTKQDRIVSFHSPANQTTIIDDLDLMIAKSLKKRKQQNEPQNNFVTTRRKRSTSLDEVVMTAHLISKLPKPVPLKNTPSKIRPLSSSTTKPLSRTKLPNFAAIHEKQFKKMENLVDHVSRKEERSRVLINSATKIRPASAQKNIPLIKNAYNNTKERPKALKKIDLGVTQVDKPSYVAENSIKTTTTTTTTNLVINKSQENKKIITTGAIPKRIPIPSTATQPQQISKYLKPTQTLNVATSRNNSKLPTATTIKPKPNFNLSTRVNDTFTASTENLNKTHTIGGSADKTAGLLQRHMDLFKGRVPATRAGARNKDAANIRGVRSNRRFELQMQHRKNMEN